MLSHSSFRHAGLSLIVTAFLIASHLVGRAETVTIPCSADTMLHEIYPENNFGAFPFVNSGTTAMRTRTRGLFKFDLAGNIPPEATVTSVSVQVALIFAAPLDLTPDLDFGLHRMLKGWEEGNKNSSEGMSGQPASEGETTWIYAKKPEQWTAPGGDPGTDFAAEASGAVPMLFTRTYTFPSTPALVADTQLWAVNPDQNFGWMLKSAEEPVAQSAKRFGSRESGQAAMLTIVYTAPASSELRFHDIVFHEGNARLSWSGGTPPYQLQKKEDITSPEWMNVGEPTTFTNAQVTAGGAQAFFRIVVAGD